MYPQRSKQLQRICDEIVKSVVKHNALSSTNNKQNENEFEKLDNLPFKKSDYRGKLLSNILFSAMNLNDEPNIIQKSIKNKMTINHLIFLKLCADRCGYNFMEEGRNKIDAYEDWTQEQNCFEMKCFNTLEDASSGVKMKEVESESRITRKIKKTADTLYCEDLRCGDIKNDQAYTECVHVHCR